MNRNIVATSEEQTDPEITIRHSMANRFALTTIQHLTGDELASAKQLCGHGKSIGFWESQGPRVPSHLRRVNLASRICSSLSKLNKCPHSADLINEGVLTLVRLGILARLAPASGTRVAKNRPLKASTVATYEFHFWPKLVALAIHRKASAAATNPGLFRYLTDDDLSTLESNERLRTELARIETLADKELWCDRPVRKPLPHVTDPSTKPSDRRQQHKRVPHPPLPQEWLAEIGPRVLWLVTDLAPNLLRLLENIRDPLTESDVWSGHRGEKVSKILIAEVTSHPWLNSGDRPLVPPFPLITNTDSRENMYEWPVRTWAQIVNLSVTVQAAHAFVALLATAGRVGEDATLGRQCIAVHADGLNHVHGRTYKLHWSPGGVKRSWPAPAILVTALGQQARLAAAWDYLPLTLDGGEPVTESQFSDQLWVSIGRGWRCGPQAQFTWRPALMGLARRLGVSDSPGGKSVHPHRFRKTTAKLAGIAMWNSPLVLKQLLGHKNIEMTLQYILSDPGIREEAENVLRELRVMHCAETLQQVRNATAAGLPNPFGGLGGARLTSAVSERETREKTAHRKWTDETAYELATQYTMNGVGWRLGIGFICAKLPHEPGECRKGASRRGEHGEPLISNCQRACAQRVELPEQIADARMQRDLMEICDGYISIASQACKEGQLLVAAGCLHQLKEELVNWPQLKRHYDAHPDVQALVKILEPQIE